MIEIQQHLQLSSPENSCWSSLSSVKSYHPNVLQLSQLSTGAFCQGFKDHEDAWCWFTAGTYLNLVLASLGECSLWVGQTQAIHSADYLQQKGESRQLASVMLTQLFPQVELKTYTSWGISHSGNYVILNVLISRMIADIYTFWGILIHAMFFFFFFNYL